MKCRFAAPPSKSLQQVPLGVGVGNLNTSQSVQWGPEALLRQSCSEIKCFPMSIQNTANRERFFCDMIKSVTISCGLEEKCYLLFFFKPEGQFLFV